MDVDGEWWLYYHAWINGDYHCSLLSRRPRDATTDDVCREDEQRAGQVDDDGQDRVAGRLACGGSAQ